MTTLFAVLMAIVLPLISTFTLNQSSPLAGAALNQATAASTAVVLAIDLSNSMSGTPLRSAKAAALQFVDTIDPRTPIALVTFATHTVIAQPFTTDKAALTKTLNGLKLGGVTALYDGSLTAVKLAASAPVPHRMVILLSDGAEYGHQSKATRQQALLLARTQQVAVYTIGLGYGADRSYLKELSTGTSAVNFEASTAAQLSAIYGTLSGPLVSAPIPASRAVKATDDSIQPVSLVILPTTTGTVTSSTAPTLSTAVVLAMDLSSTVSNPALVKAKAAAQAFLDKLDPATPVAIVTFASQSRVAQPFTTDRIALKSVVDGLRLGGASVLYDGSLTAVKLASTATADQRVVILFSASTDSAAASKTSGTARQAALKLASNQNIAVYTIGMGAKVDRTYLKALSTGTNAINYDAANADTLLSVYTTLGNQFAGVPANNPLLADANPAAVPSIAPLGGLSGLNIPPAQQGDPAIRPVSDKIGHPAANPQPAVIAAQPAVAPVQSGATDPKAAVQVPADVQTATNLVPISVTVPTDSEITAATLALNGTPLATFPKAPYTYTLDTSVLRAGDYTLSFSTVNAKGVLSQGSLDFQVALATAAPTTGGAAASPAVKADPANTVAVAAPQANAASAVSAPVTNAASGLQPGAAAVPASAPLPTVKDSVNTDTLTPTLRVLLVQGKRQPLTLSFSTDKGLVVVAATVTPTSAANQTLGDILTQPTQLIPPNVRLALTAQHPTLWTIIILLMTITLLPQGLFTLYYMMYTWNNPEAAEEFRSPKVFTAPQHSFTALLPARHEEAVIADTIRAVDRINYPDHLKEVLVLCRTDDVGTIEKARAAIAELGKDNIRVVTFSTGPINKPHGLNIGLREAHNQVISVFDAEDEPHPDLYNIVNTVMQRDGADVVQSGVQLMNFASSWFSALNCLEYFFWFKSGLHCFTRALKVTPLGGNTVFFKKHWLEKINGWDENCLTEDADVGFRLTLLGAKMQIVYDEQHATQEETPHNVESFIKQRTRWCQGFYEIFFKGDWLKLPELKQKITALYILLNSLMQAATVLYLPIGLYVALTQHISVPVALISYLPIFMLLLQLVVNLIGIREFAAAYDKKLPFGFSAKMILVYYPYQLLLVISSLRAVQHFISKNNAWEKTAHSNLHRQGQVIAEPGV
ncbi:MAG: glycosyltransferase [Chloroflexota bacterium]